jgi:Asp-tRNA(Asn)/Glu-tRNA(Gln) amidotransferase A subunit family amidase
VNDPYRSVVSWIDRPAMDGPLGGLRIGVKDVIAVAGVPRLCGAPGLVDASPSDEDAEVVARLVAAGAQVVATTTCHQLSFGLTTPGTVNPRSPRHIAGGSSGGAAAALAGGIIDAAVGTDTAGSVRIPAACCGVVALKTSEGVVSRQGVLPLAPSFDSVGPMARDTTTTRRMLEVMSGQKLSPQPDRGLRIGVVRQAVDSPIHPEVRAVWDAVLDQLRARHRIVDVSIPLLATAHPALGRIIAAEGYRLHGHALREHPDSLLPDVRGRLEAGERMTQDKLLHARRTAAMLRDRLTGVFAQVDVLVLPVLPCRVPRVDDDLVDVGGTDEAVASALTRLVGPWNLAGVTAGAVPCDRDRAGAPVALQVVGPWQAEATVLGAMAAIESAVGGPWPAVSAPTS